LRLLIADDYTDAAESLAMLLGAAGVETAVAFDGEAALDQATRWRPHICVLDLDMPKIDGHEIARRIREQGWPDRPLLIALTGLTTAQDVGRAMEAGFDHYILKPVEPQKLMGLIHGHLSNGSGQ
jgi:CheY-like chemotaxis protein